MNNAEAAVQPNPKLMSLRMAKFAFLRLSKVQVQIELEMGNFK